MTQRILSALFTLSRVAESDTNSGLITPTHIHTTGGSGTVRTYSCGQ